MSLKLRQPEVVHSKYRSNSANRRLHRSDITKAPLIRECTHSNAVIRRQLNLHYKIYTAGYRLLHYNSPASRGLLHYKLYTAGYRLLHYKLYTAGYRLLHYKFYTAGYRLLHYNSPASRGLLHYKFYTAGYRLYITTAPPVGGLTLQVLHSRIQALQQPRQSRASTLQVTLPTSYSQHKKRRQQSTKHYNEELPLSSKLGQVSAMSSITSYVKDSLSKLNSTRFSEVQV
ncbi:hypothetical protein KY289_004973 [Solanum tuberosum]|nr:hypothetical protein KY289_004973 [Solanum tuberosum]